MNLWVGTNIQTTANSKMINTRSVPGPEAWSIVEELPGGQQRGIPKELGRKEQKAHRGPLNHGLKTSRIRAESP